MKEKLAKTLLGGSIGCGILCSILAGFKVEPFKTYFYILIWWSYLLAADSWLYWKGEGSLFLKKPIDFLTFIAPMSAFFWFIFEAFNLRLHNWSYIHVPMPLFIRWAGNFLAFGSVLPGIFLTANLLEHYRIFPRNNFSSFFRKEGNDLFFCGVGIGMMALPLFLPDTFFPLVWGGLFLVLDPLNASMGKISILEEWRQRNWNRTFQLLLAGLICGFLWEFWNFWAGAKWIYTFSLPSWALPKAKIFEMPILGFLGFPPFALECFAFTEFMRALKERLPNRGWNLIVLLAFLFSLAVCYFMDIYTVRSFR